MYTLTVQPPIAGVNKRPAFQSQAPFTSYKSVNWWPSDPMTGRAISATRPPLTAFESPGAPVNMLVRINAAVENKPLLSMVSAFDGDVYWWDGVEWQAATGDDQGNVPTGVPVYGATMFQEVFIPQFGEKPLVFNYVDGTVTELVETAGEIPDDLRMFAVWQGSLWGAGRIVSPHILYGSRAADPYDWNFAAPVTDTGGAYFTGGEDEGRLRGPITALMPQTSDTMIVSTTEGLAALRAHPRDGGVFEDISDVYVMGQGAWCKGPDNTLFMMTRLGLYMLPPNPGAVPAAVSAKIIPDELVGLPYDYANPTVAMEYSSRHNGIFITVRGTRQQAWFYEFQTGGFHKLNVQAFPYILEEFFPEVTQNTCGVLWCGAGYGGIARMDRLGAETFTAELVIGPVRLAEHATQAAKIQQAKFLFGGDTPTVDGTVEFSVGASAEDAVRRLENGGAQYETSLDFLDENNGVCYPMVSGHAVALKITLTGGRCALEELALVLVDAGVPRLIRYKLPFACRGYATATPQIGPDGNFDDGIEMVNLAALPEAWWDLTNDDGGNIRVSDEDNNFLAFDLIGFEKDNERGAMVVRRPLPPAPRPLRCWVCDQDLARFPVGHAFGQYNAYPPWMIAIWPGGFGPNRAQFAWPLEPASGSPPDEAINPFHPNNPSQAGTGQPDENCETPEDFFGLVGIGRFNKAFSGNPLPPSHTIHYLFGIENVDPCNTEEPRFAGDAGNHAQVVYLEVETAVDAGVNEHSFDWWLGTVKLDAGGYTATRTHWKSFADTGPHAGGFFPELMEDIEIRSLFSITGILVQADGSTVVNDARISIEPSIHITLRSLPAVMNAEDVENAIKDEINDSAAKSFAGANLFQAMVVGSQWEFAVASWFVSQFKADTTNPSTNPAPTARAESNAEYWGEWEFVENTTEIPH